MKQGNKDIPVGTAIRVHDPASGRLDKATTRSLPVVEEDVSTVYVTFEATGDKHWAFWDADQKRWEKGPL